MNITKGLRIFFLCLCVAILNGCYEIRKGDDVKGIAVGQPALLGTFTISLRNDNRTLKSLTLAADQDISEIMVRALGSPEWKPADAIDLVLKNNATTVFEVVGIVDLAPGQKVRFSLSNFVLEDSKGGVVSSNTKLAFEALARDTSALFHSYVAYPAGDDTRSVVAGDMNADGLTDVVITSGNQLMILPQNMNGQLEAPFVFALSGSRPESLVVDDLNHDGRLDIAVAVYSLGVDMYIQDSSGQFSHSLIATSNSLALRSGDFNYDGRKDLAGIGWSSGVLEIRYQTEDGSFANVDSIGVEYGGYNDMAVGDMNGDGRDDIIVMSGQTYAIPNFSILYQHETGLSEPDYFDLGFNQNANGIAIGDVNGDGAPDVALSYGGNSPGSHIAFFLGDGAGGLQAPVSITSYDIPEVIRVADINGDGRDDVVTLHGGWLRAGTYMQTVDGSLREEVLYETPYASHYNRDGLAIADLNNDGLVDMAIADYNNGLVILYGR